MKNYPLLIFFKILLTIICCAIPWVSLLFLFRKSIQESRKINTIASLIFIVCESYIIFNILTKTPFEIGMLYPFVMVSVIGSIYTLIVIIDDKKISANTNKSLNLDNIFIFSTVILLCAFPIWLCVQTHYIYYCIFAFFGFNSLYNKKYTEVAFYISVIFIYYYLYNMGYTQYYFALIPIFTTATLSIMVTLENSGTTSIIDSKLIFFINKLLNKNLTTPQTTNPTVGLVENIKPETIISKARPTHQSKPYDKGWTVDDTKQLDITLISIEDIIYPIALKNEYEKSTQELIIHIRKLERYNNTDIKYILGNEEILSHLEKSFNKIEFDAVRSVYIRSLSIALENYSKRDNRVLPYLQKLFSIEKGSNLI